MELLVITGMSGSGKTSVMNYFQDNGYYCMDNVPPQLIKDFLFLLEKSNIDYQKIAVAIDIRGAAFFADISESIEQIRLSKHDLKVLFVDADDETLIKRYKQNRRPHPIQGTTIEKAIGKERKFLDEIRNLSDYYLNTTSLNLQKLKISLDEMFETSDKFQIKIISFGFKNGILKEADWVLDARFLENPFYVDSLRDKSGLDPQVRDFVLNNDLSPKFLDKLTDMVDYLEGAYRKQGKNSLVIGIGCTGGKHRSVALSEALCSKLSEKYFVSIFHRERDLW